MLDEGLCVLAVGFELVLDVKAHSSRDWFRLGSLLGLQVSTTVRSLEQESLLFWYACEEVLSRRGVHSVESSSTQVPSERGHVHSQPWRCEQSRLAKKNTTR